MTPEKIQADLDAAIAYQQAAAAYNAAHENEIQKYAFGRQFTAPVPEIQRSTEPAPSGEEDDGEETSDEDSEEDSEESADNDIQPDEAPTQPDETAGMVAQSDDEIVAPKVSKKRQQKHQ